MQSVLSWITFQTFMDLPLLHVFLIQTTLTVMMIMKID